MVCSEPQETLYNYYFEGSSGPLDDFSDWKSMVEGGIYYMALLRAITLRNDSLPGLTITVVGKPDKLPLIYQTHTAHITSSTVKCLLFQDGWHLCLHS